jgi:hypothetical protein
VENYSGIDGRSGMVARDPAISQALIGPKTVCIHCLLPNVKRGNAPSDPNLIAHGRVTSARTWEAIGRASQALDSMKSIVLRQQD